MCHNAEDGHMKAGHREVLTHSLNGLLCFYIGCAVAAWPTSEWAGASVKTLQCSASWHHETYSREKKYDIVVFSEKFITDDSKFLVAVIFSLMSNGVCASTAKGTGMHNILFTDGVVKLHFPLCSFDGAHYCLPYEFVCEWMSVCFFFSLLLWSLKTD